MEWRINLDLKNFKPEFNLTHNLYTVTYVNLLQQHDNPWALLINFVVLQLNCSEKKTNQQTRFSFWKVKLLFCSNFFPTYPGWLSRLISACKPFWHPFKRKPWYLSSKIQVARSMTSAMHFPDSRFHVYSDTLSS